MADKKLYRTQASDVLECFNGHDVRASMQVCKAVADAVECGHRVETHGVVFQPIQVLTFSKFSASKV